MKLELSLPPKHAACLLSGKKHLVLHGGRAGMKSTAAADFCIGRALEKKRKICCGRQFQASMKHSSKSLIEERIEKLGLRDQFFFTDAVIRCVNGSEIIFIGLEKNIDSIRSMNDIALWWIEEARNVTQKVLNVLLPTMRALGCECIWTYNPVNRDDPVDEYFRGPNRRADAFVQEVNYPDNPHLDTNTSLRVEIDDLRARNYLAYMHTWMGAYDERANSRVFDPKFYRFGYPEGEPLRIPILYGGDHGFSQDPFALLKLIPYPRNVLYIAAEKLAHGAVIDTLPGIVLEFLHNPDAVVMVDSARKELNDYLRRNGCPNVVDVKKPPGSVETGFKRLQGFTFVINPACEQFYREVHDCVWPTNPLTGARINDENPVGGHGQHLLDCARYATINHFPTPIGDETSDYDRLMADHGGVFRVPLWQDRRYDNPYGQ
jgi:phage terminase large subunit